MEETSLKTIISENYLINPPEISDFNDKNDSFILSLNKLNPSSLIFLNQNGDKIDSNNPYLHSSLIGVICKNPNIYSGEDIIGINGKNIPKSSYNSLAASIRQSRDSFCSGQISKSYFLDSQKNCDIFFLLYLLLIPNRSSNTLKRTIRLIGFACCNDLSRNNYNHDENLESLYIDLLCTKLQLRGTEKIFNFNDKASLNFTNIPTHIKPGKIIMKLIEEYCVNNQFKQIKLSSLGYVINYYRRLGFCHYQNLHSLEDNEIKKIATKNLNYKFESESQANLTYLVEKVIFFLDRTRDKENQENDFIVNLRTILKNTDTSFESFKPSEEDPYIITKKILNMLPKPKNKKKLTLDMISCKSSNHYFGYYQLLFLLIKNKFAVSYENGKFSQRTKIKNTEDQEIDFSEDGFSMSKKINVK